MKTKNYYFSTPKTNPEDGAPNPWVLVTEKRFWDAGQTIEEDSELSHWMRRNGFGELMPNYYQADHPELITPEDIRNFLTNKGLSHNAALDPTLEEGF